MNLPVDVLRDVGEMITWKTSKVNLIFALALFVVSIAASIAIADDPEDWIGAVQVVSLAGTASSMAAVRIIDGDTFETARGVRVRLAGADAPEITETGGDYAALTLWAFINQVGHVTCIERNQDHYGRFVAFCLTDGGHDLAQQLVFAGVARDARRYGPDYRSTEDLARAAHAGFWDCADGEPESWRADKAKLCPQP